MFRIEVTEINPLSEVGAPAAELKVFSQCVDTIDLRALFAAVNQRQRKQRTPNTKKEVK